MDKSRIKSWIFGAFCDYDLSQIIEVAADQDQYCPDTLRFK